MLIGCLCSQFMEECRSVAYLCHVNTPQLIGCEGKNGFIKGKEGRIFIPATALSAACRNEDE